MTSLAARVQAAILRRQLCPRGARVVASVSGGADSVALAHVLMELSKSEAVILAGVAHLNHRLRGDESTRDRAFCQALAADLGVPFDVEEIDVATEARRQGLSIEQAARKLRYAFLERARVRLRADAVAVAHTRDDQAETVLLRLLRGTGTRGLAAIRPSRDRVIRPLLDLRHADLVAYLKARSHQWVEDSTNQDRRIPRNWVRHEVLPFLSARVGDGVVEVLARTAESAAEDDALLDGLAREAAGRIVRLTPNALLLDADALGSEPPAIARRIIGAGLEDTSGHPATLAQIGTVLELISAGGPGLVSTGRAEVELSGAPRVLSIRVPREPGPSPTVEPRRLSVPGAVELPETGLRLRAELRKLEDLGGIPGIRRAGCRIAVVPERAIGSAVLVRSWQPGDALQPLGLSGRKKVQDLLVDRKVPRAGRHSVPIVTANDGRIVWVAGYALGEPFRVTPATKSVVVLSFEPLEAPK
jgi:tRNA(Ile)-lysidine synthase